MTGCVSCEYCQDGKCSLRGYKEVGGNKFMPEWCPLRRRDLSVKRSRLKYLDLRRASACASIRESLDIET